MKLCIERDFTDKYTGEEYKKGTKVDFQKKRADELLADERGLVSLAKETKAEKVEKIENTED